MKAKGHSGIELHRALESAPMRIHNQGFADFGKGRARQRGDLDR
jgi:hypothetical protein